MEAKSERLEPNDFRQLIEIAPLVAVDLIIRSSSGQILAGLRRNEPASGFWFVPGGRITKNSTIEDTLRQLAYRELYPSVEVVSHSLFGVFEHFYDNSFFPDADVSTHYVVLAFDVIVNDLNIDLLSTVEHSEWKFVEADSVEDVKIHPIVLPYFAKEDLSSDLQYQLIVARRQHYDNLLWQTPVIGLTAQAFLLTLAFDGDNAFGRMFAAGLSLMTALASFHLMNKHRQMEVMDSKLLESYEIANLNRGFIRIHGRARILAKADAFSRQSSKFVWGLLMISFSAVALFALVSNVMQGLDTGETSGSVRIDQSQGPRMQPSPSR